MTPRQAAKQAGETKYLASPCAEHGLVPRFTSNGTCVYCQHDADQRYRQRNKATRQGDNQ